MTAPETAPPPAVPVVASCRAKRTAGARCKAAIEALLTAAPARWL